MQHAKCEMQNARHVMREKGQKKINADQSHGVNAINNQRHAKKKKIKDDDAEEAIATYPNQIRKGV